MFKKILIVAISAVFMASCSSKKGEEVQPSAPQETKKTGTTKAVSTSNFSTSFFTNRQFNKAPGSHYVSVRNTGNRTALVSIFASQGGTNSGYQLGYLTVAPGLSYSPVAWVDVPVGYDGIFIILTKDNPQSGLISGTVYVN